MAPKTLLLAALCALPTALADFYIYTGTMADAIGGNGVQQLAYFFNGPPSCDDVLNTGSTPFSWTNDVSGSPGVACDGCDLNVAVADQDITRFEFNNGMGHYTIYQDRGYGLYDLGDVQQGTCTRQTDDDFTCSDVITSFSASQIFFCSSAVNADSQRAKKRDVPVAFEG